MQTKGDVFCLSQRILDFVLFSLQNSSMNKVDIPKRVIFENREYEWDGKTWYDRKSCIIPPLHIMHKLNGLIFNELTNEDEQINDVSELFQRARSAKETVQHNRAEIILKRILKLSPNNLPALSMLCSTLRENGEPARALEVTDPFKNHKSEYLLASRAAAFCDLEQWEEAYQQIKKAIEVAGKRTEFTDSVLNRIRQGAPELFEDE